MGILIPKTKQNLKTFKKIQKQLKGAMFSIFFYVVVLGQLEWTSQNNCFLRVL